MTGHLERYLVSRGRSFTPERRRCSLQPIYRHFDGKLIPKQTGSIQCDQMAKIILKYLAICNNENLPNGKRSLPQYCQILKNPQKFPHMIDFVTFTKIA